MPMHPNFEVRCQGDVEASLAAVMSVLRVILEKEDVDLDRGHQLLTNATGDDMNLRARARWFVDWMVGNHDTQGERP